MPIFDYRCQDCLEEFEYFSAKADVTPSCPSCTGTRLIRQASGFAVGNSNLKDPMPAAQETETTESGHTCTSACKHGTESRKHDHSQGPHGGCARSYADSLREKYG